MGFSHWRELPRQGIVRTLAKSIASHFLTTVTAPAGFGKTTIAHKLTGQGRKRVFHFSVPAGIADARHWWDALFESLSEQGMESASALRLMGFPQNDSMTRRILDRIRGASPPFVLLIDDWHNFLDPGVDAFFERLVRSRPLSHRFVLFSRATPLSCLEEMKQSGLAATYDQRLLEFSEADAVRLFFLNGVSDKTAARQAWRYSGGWAAALWLCLHSRATEEGRLPDDIENLLETSVFSAYSDADRDALMRLSVFDSFTAGEAGKLVSDAGASRRIRRLCGVNAFIRYDADAGKYAFHSIFKDFLGKKLAARDDLNIPELHRRAAECHILRREFMPACRLLAKAGRDGDLVRILEVLLLQNGEKTLDCQLEEIQAIVESIPWRLRLEQPLGYMAFLVLLFGKGIEPATVERFEAACRRFAEAKEIPPYLKRRLAGEAEYMRGWIYVSTDFPAITRHYAEACSLLDGPSFNRHERLCWSFSVPHAMSLMFVGEERYQGLLEMMCRRVLPLLLTLSGGVTRGAEHVCQAEYHLERGEFEQALRLLNDAEELVDIGGNATSTIMARFSRARLLAATGDPEGAIAALEALSPAIGVLDSFEHVQCLELASGHILAVVGRPAAAPRWLQDGDIFEQPYGDTLIQGFMAATHVRILLAKGDFDRLAAFVSDGPGVFGSTKFVFNRIHAAVCDAILAWRRADAAGARTRLREAVELCRPDGFVLSLAEYGSHILPVLHSVMEENPDDDLLRTTTALAEQTARSPHIRRKDVGRVLSRRECDVMRLVVRGRATRSIAAKLGIAETTVKKTLSSVYRKLKAGNRAEAAHLFQAAYGRRRKTGDAMRRHTEAAVAPAETAGPTFSDADIDRLASDETEQEHPQADLPAVYREEGARLIEQGDLMGAFRLFLRAGGDEDLARTLDLFLLPGAGTMTACFWDEVVAAVQSYPWSVRAMRPMGYLAFLWQCFRTGGEMPLGLWLDEAEERFFQKETFPPELKRRLRGETALLRGALHADDAAAFRASHDAALRELGGPSHFYSPQTSWSGGNPSLAFAAVREVGDFARVADDVSSMAPVFSILSNRTFLGMETAFLLERSLERAQLDDARAFLPDLEIRCAGDLQAAIIAAFVKARLLLAEGNADGATDALERLLPAVRQSGSYEHRESLDLAIGYANARPGRLDRVPAWIRSDALASPPHGAALRRPFALTVHGKVLAAEGKYTRLDSVARTMPLRFGRCHGSLLGRIHGKTLEALAARYLRGEEEALSHLREAVELSRGDGLIFSIAEYGDLAAPLLRRLRRDNPGDEHTDRLMMFADWMGRRAGGAAGGNRRALTFREREVMRLVMHSLSNAAIAKQLGVSESRIEKVLSNAYSKLGASNRAEAARRFEMKFAAG